MFNKYLCNTYIYKLGHHWVISFWKTIQSSDQSFATFSVWHPPLPSGLSGDYPQNVPHSVFAWHPHILVSWSTSASTPETLLVYKLFLTIFQRKFPEYQSLSNEDRSWVTCVSREGCRWVACEEFQGLSGPSQVTGSGLASNDSLLWKSGPSFS